MMIIGVVHLLHVESSEYTEHAVRNARMLEEAGVDAIIVENYYDYPYKPRADFRTAIAVTVAARDVARAVSVPVGVNLLRGACRKAAVIARYAEQKTGGKFMRPPSTPHRPPGAGDPGAPDGPPGARRRGGAALR